MDVNNSVTRNFQRRIFPVRIQSYQCTCKKPPFSAHIEFVLAATVVADVKCCGCAKNIPSAEAFACKTCTTDKVLSFCALCCMKAHRHHEMVELDKLASLSDICRAQIIITTYNEQLLNLLPRLGLAPKVHIVLYLAPCPRIRQFTRQKFQ